MDARVPTIPRSASSSSPSQCSPLRRPPMTPGLHPHWAHTIVKVAECPEVVIGYGEVTSAAVAGVVDLKNRQNPMVKMEDDDENARRSEL